MDQERKELVSSSRLAGGVRVLTLDRAGKANALNAEIVDQLLARVIQAEEEGCRALILSANGKAFCGGFDFGGYEDMTPGDLLLRFVRIEQLLQRLRRSSFVSVALVHGAAMGAGADIVASCTYRIGTEASKFRFPGFRFGVALGTRHLAQLVGMQRARDILLTGATLDAKTAFDIGLLTHLSGPDDLRQRADELIGQTGSLDTRARNRISHLTAPQSDDGDMAELVRSVSAPGLHERIAQYRAGH
jgi:enoyl-CoA hydratase/carnithine racemase